MSSVVLSHVSKIFAARNQGQVKAVNDFTLTIGEGECFSFLGPSGCGKTTTLRMIAGFEDLSEGEIFLGDRLVSSRQRNIYVPPEARGLGMVFQAFAVWPHMTVFDNVAFPLKVKRSAKAKLPGGSQRRFTRQTLTVWTKSTPTACPAGSCSASRSPGPSSPIQSPAAG